MPGAADHKFFIKLLFLHVTEALFSYYIKTLI